MANNQSTRTETTEARVLRVLAAVRAAAEREDSDDIGADDEGVAEDIGTTVASTARAMDTLRAVGAVHHGKRGWTITARGLDMLAALDVLTTGGAR